MMMTREMQRVQDGQHTIHWSEALEIAVELYDELYVDREHSDMQKYKLEELIEALGGKPNEYVR
jgi:hypothetical protein